MQYRILKAMGGEVAQLLARYGVAHRVESGALHPARGQAEVAVGSFGYTVALTIMLAGLEQKLKGSLGSVQKMSGYLFFGFPRLSQSPA
ncbi:hypothetical protein GCM10011378_00450 [Hymenobacter glacieicola]|uniref:Uncharacterized protein n=1 Tax=Hymenobacter glacieicola TaxID=1562124 RepID=A0ABQ1WDP5_9BACT|nr:hypothetical protein GCM10011378_00450 [Hymenobacter glacieicola]